MSTPDLVVDGWHVDVAAHQITRGDVIRRVEPKVMQVLALLAERPGVVAARAHLLDIVWGGAFVGDDAVSAAIIKIRRAFDDSARSPRVIETVHKSGYRLIASVVTYEIAPKYPGAMQTDAEIPSTVKVATLMRCSFRIEPPPSTSMTPEDWRWATDTVAGLIDDAIRRNLGEPIRESGSTIGVFGAPVAEEHHAIRAVQAAMDFREEAMTTLASVLDRFRCSWHVALASGQILSSPTVVGGGRTVHGAPLQRVISLGGTALPGEILLAGETRELALGLLGVQVCAPRPHDVGVGDFYCIDDRARWSTRWQARMERGLTPLVGRDHEIGRIDDFLGNAIRAEGRVIAISGEPGAGKSRLVHESLLRAATLGFDTFVAAASPLEARTPFFPLRDVLTDRLRLNPGVLTDEATLQSHLEQLETTRLLDVAALLAALRPDRMTDGWTAIDPEVRRSRSMRALLDVLIDDERPSLIVFEDLHWADQATVQFVDALVAQIARRPCVSMISYRPEFIDRWATKSYYTSLRIDPLSSLDSARMIDHLVGSDPSLERWKSAVVGRAGGTPLFIEEVVRSARLVGTLTGVTGALELADPFSPSDVPASVHTLLADRIGRLSAGAGDILSLAAVIGRDVPASLLDSLISGTLADRHEDIDELQAAELLFGSRSQRQTGFVFKHALTQQVAYSEIPQLLRREHHRRVAVLLEASIAGGGLVSPELLARHHSGAEQHQDAIHAWIRAAEAANNAAAFADALDHLEQARSLLRHTTTRERDGLELAIELVAASALIQSIGPADQAVEDAYRRARRLADSAGTAQQRFEAAWGLWFVHLMQGRINTARQLGDELFELAAGLNDPALELEAHHVQWAGLSLAGDPASVRRHTEVGIEQYRRDEHHWLTFSYGGHDPGVCARNLDAMAHWLLGEPNTARQRSASALSLADDLAHGYTRLESFNSALNIALLDGDAPALLSLTSVLYAMVDDGTLPVVASSYADGFRAGALVLEGNLEAGLALMRSAGPVWREFWGAWCFPLESAFATMLALAGNTAEAIDHVESRLDLADKSGSHWWDPEFHRVLGELVWAHDANDVRRAEVSIRRGIDEARRQRARFFELRAATSLARLYRATAKRDEALELLDDACNGFPTDAELTDLAIARALRDELTRASSPGRPIAEAASCQAVGSADDTSTVL